MGTLGRTATWALVTRTVGIASGSPSGAAMLPCCAPECFEVLHSSCFTPKPRCMRNNYQALSSLTLLDMLIPGTHDSGMYDQGPALPHEVYLYTQDQTIKQQLAYGIRALDLRVQYSKRQFFIPHDRWRGRPKLT
ncbi:hypothetical protein HPB50_022955 [Hyalomma asiaticum]|uniref:Uncharacterized protein n=1 Tax=Hyalomma asiaticum TaxID=266040 RepID=A0ACB7SBA5_HYAAI|nr:hypothetical protein HPB50_022955 [Hyalomma asiaticum]